MSKENKQLQAVDLTVKKYMDPNKDKARYLIEKIGPYNPKDMVVNSNKDYTPHVFKYNTSTDTYDLYRMEKTGNIILQSSIKPNDIFKVSMINELW